MTDQVAVKSTIVLSPWVKAALAKRLPVKELSAGHRLASDCGDIVCVMDRQPVAIHPSLRPCAR